MAIIDILLPKMGESVAEATIIKLLVDAGSSVEADEAVVEIATDKVDSEVPAPEDGVLVEWLIAEGDVIQVGEPIARYEIGGSDSNHMKTAAPQSASTPAPPQSNSTNAPSPEVVEAVSAPLASLENQKLSKSGSSGRFYSPLVRSIAEEEGVSMAELESIPGSGSEGRVTKKDILGFISTGRKTVSAPKVVTHDVATSSNDRHPAFKSVSGGYEIVEMDRMRKLIAKHMLDSVSTSPHVTSFVEADVTSLVLWRNKNKNAFLDKFGEKLTFTPLIAEAIIKAIGDFPGVNASVDGDNVVIHKGIHLGMAAALPSGNLIVPVIKDANSYNLQGLARKVNDLALRARQGKLEADDISGGTYTMSNVGTFGNVMGTPIINQPQVGILALGAIRKKPAVIETPEGDVIAIRHMMFLSHSYDHRVVDGKLGGSFVKRVAEYLEAFSLERPLEG
ncbi:MAG: 2-oxoglutarate dehydrogenase [Bacteroidetes bacterium]|nr:MAG: 2-oxoglutarate dehydrogenase [Bacteroidota bacterium]